MDRGHCLFQGLDVLHSPAFSHDSLERWVGWKPPLQEVRGQVMEVAAACSGQVSSGILLLNKC